MCIRDSFEYQQLVAIRALEPSRGPIEGGTFVNVTGSGFSARAALLGYVWCRFNSTSVAAAWRSATELHCIAPRHAAGVVSVELTQNKQQYTSDGVRFEFEVVAAYSVHPSTGPSGGGMVRICIGMDCDQASNPHGMRLPCLCARGESYCRCW